MLLRGEIAQENAFVTLRWDIPDETFTKPYVHEWAKLLYNSYISFLETLFEIDFITGIDPYVAHVQQNKVYSKQSYPFSLEYSFKITGEYAFGLLQNEAGIHRSMTEASQELSDVEVQVVPEAPQKDVSEVYKHRTFRTDVFRTFAPGTPYTELIQVSG